MKGKRQVVTNRTKRRDSATKDDDCLFWKSIPTSSHFIREMIIFYMRRWREIYFGIEGELRLSHPIALLNNRQVQKKEMHDETRSAWPKWLVASGGRGNADQISIDRQLKCFVKGVNLSLLTVVYQQTFDWGSHRRCTGERCLRITFGQCQIDGRLLRLRRQFTNITRQRRQSPRCPRCFVGDTADIARVDIFL